MSVPQNILVVGASGFIGTALCSHLKTVWPQANFHALARETSNVPRGVYKHVADDWSLAGLTKVTNGHVFDVIFNLAAYGVSPSHRDFAQMQAVNVALPSTLVQFAHKHGAYVIHTGSSAEYASIKYDVAADLYLDEMTSPLNSQTLYGASKAAGAMMAMARAKALDVTFINLRLFNVFGAGEASHRLFPSLVAAAQTRQIMALSDGLQLRDFIHVEDVCRAFELAATLSTAAPQQCALNICSGAAVSVRDFALSVFGALGASPSLLKFGVIERRPDDLVRVVGKPDRAAADIGFRIRHPLQATLDQALNARMDAA